MLDQNTDRMWYVIGALVVGAGIILLANGTLPSLFASVTNSFDEASDNALSVVDEIGERQTGQNIIHMSGPIKYGEGLGKLWTDFDGQFAYGEDILAHHTTYRFTGTAHRVDGEPLEYITVAPIEWLRTGIGNTQLYGTVPVYEDGSFTYTFTTDAKDYGFIIYAGTYPHGGSTIPRNLVTVTLSDYELVELK